MLVVTGGAAPRANGTYRIRPGDTVRFEQVWYAWGAPTVRLDLLVVASPARLQAATRRPTPTNRSGSRRRVDRSRVSKTSASRISDRHTSRRRCGAWQ